MASRCMLKEKVFIQNTVFFVSVLCNDDIEQLFEQKIITVSRNELCESVFCKDDVEQLIKFHLKRGPSEGLAFWRSKVHKRYL